VAVRAETLGRRRTRAASSLVDRNIRWLLVAPAVVIIVALTIFPLLFSVWVSFVQFDFSISNEHPWVGLDNFKNVWQDPVWVHSLWVTALIATAAVVIELGIGLLLALAADLVRLSRRAWAEGSPVVARTSRRGGSEAVRLVRSVPWQSYGRSARSATTRLSQARSRRSSLPRSTSSRRSSAKSSGDEASTTSST
jgi:hypothetical protein